MSVFALQRRKGPSVAAWGMAMFIASETTLFAIMIASYFYIRFKNVAWPPRGIDEPKVVVPLVLLGVLLASIAPMTLAALAARGGRVRTARWLVLLALIVQAGYFAIAVHLYFDDLAQFTPQDHAYGSIYFTLLGADHAHVALGLLFDLWILAKLVRGLTTYRLNALTAIALYWLAVGVITIAVTLTILSPAV
jgi:cytochrome c oxidase subunit 3/cytochrome c oxidase subunit I+III